VDHKQKNILSPSEILKRSRDHKQTMKTGMSIETADESLANEIPQGDGAAEAEEQTLEEAQEDAQKQEGASAPEQKELQPGQEQKKKNPDLRMVHGAEAALFIANRVVSFEELARVMSISKQTARTLVEKLKEEYDSKEGAIEVVIGGEGAMLQAKPEFLQNASELSKKPDVSRKATRILALVAKKGGMLQSELKKYFRGEIYEYTTELKEAGYIDSEKRGNTRYLRPSKKFSANFQIA